MAVPTVNDSNSGSETSNTTTHTVNLPATVSAGELLIVWMAFDGAPTVTWDNTSHGTWSNHIDTPGPSSACKLVVKAKVADGTEGGGTLSIETSASEQSVHRSVSIGTWEGTLAGGLNVPAAATGTSSTPNPPLATASWGNVDRKTIAIEGCDGARTVSAYPASYTLNQFSDASGGGAGCGLGSAGRNQTGVGNQDPGTFTISSSDQWVAATVSVRGGVAGVIGSLSQTLGALLLAASGLVGVGGISTPALGALTSSASSQVGVAGALQTPLGALTPASSGDVALVGTSQNSLGALTVSASAVVSSGPVGDLAVTLGDVIVSGQATVPLVGVAASSLDPLTLSGLAGIETAGQTSVSLGALTISGVAGVEAAGNTSVALGVLLTSGGAVVDLAGTLSAALEDLNASAGAGVPLVAGLSTSLESLTVSGSATTGIGGDETKKRKKIKTKSLVRAFRISRGRMRGVY